MERDAMPEQESIVVGYATEGQGAGPVFVTERAGLFAAWALDVSIRKLGSATNVVRALLAGEIAFGNLAAPALLHAALDGHRLRYITGGINQHFLVGRPGLTTVEELRHGRLGASGPGDLGFLLNRFVITQLQKRGIEGLQVVDVGGGRERVQKLLSGEIDAAPISPPVAIEARRAGCPYLLDFAEFGLNFTLGGVATTQDVINSRPDLVRRFVHAYVAGMHRYKTDRVFTMSVQQEYSELADATIAAETYAITEPGFPRAPYPVTSGLQILLDTLALEDARARGVDPVDLIDDQFVRELDQSGWIDRLYHR
jgi:ABC-type nitrate/sulfonate/bicarbonate transport system substrate-binding protein